jgi:hypothetical protein
MFLTSSLFNEKGQALMSGRWSPVNRSLRELIDENVRGGVLSLHWDRGDAYVELKLEHTPDVSDADLIVAVQRRLETALKNINEQISSLPSVPYWNRLRQRFDNMLIELERNARIGAEHHILVANAWVPAVAIHNLIAGSDLMLGFTSGVDVAVDLPVESSGPKTFDELLNTSRRLQVTTNPDLNVLVQNLQTEINAEYPGLEYPFQVLINGNDLLLEGITKNQRPGDFELKDVSVAEILTEIVVRANPDKAATGPHDERCKLIWIISEDPDDATRKIIEITTRKAAENRKAELPEPFRVQSDNSSSTE